MINPFFLYKSHVKSLTTLKANYKSQAPVKDWVISLAPESLSTWLLELYSLISAHILIKYNILLKLILSTC